MAKLTSNIVVKDINRIGTKVSLKESPSQNCWRLVHDGVKVLDLFETSGLTWTKHELFAATTKEECNAEIARLGLKPLADPEPKLGAA